MARVNGVSSELAARYAERAMGALTDDQYRDIFLLSSALLTSAQNANHAALMAMNEMMGNQNPDGARESHEFMRKHLLVIKNSLVSIGGVINGKVEG